MLGLTAEREVGGRVLLVLVGLDNCCPDICRRCRETKYMHNGWSKALVMVMAQSLGLGVMIPVQEHKGFLCQHLARH